MRNCLLLILVSIAVFYSCSKEKVVVPDVGHGYAGLELGKFVVYDVDSVFYDDFNNTVDTTIFQIKEIVIEKFTDLEGDEAFKIHRYRKNHDTSNWVLKDVWNAKLTQTNFQKVEENVRFVKLIFPVRKNNLWNGNAMNNLGKNDYEYISIDDEELVGGNVLDSVLTVLQENDQTNLINPKIFEEKYAKDIGMVYKRNMDLVRNSFSAPWFGNDVTMILNSYGN